MTIITRNRRWISMLAVFCLVVASLGSVVGAAGASDIKGHWAEEQINEWLEKGIVKGFEDGSFKPGQTITRAEFTALANRSFGFTEKSEIAFSDVLPANWYYSEVQVGVEAGYITGFQNNTFAPNDVITRQQIAVIVAKLLDLKASDSYVSAFEDEASIAAWSKDAVAAVADNNIMSGYNQLFNPTGSATRAEAVVVLFNALKAKESAAKDVVYDTAGTYGPETGTETITGDVTVSVEGITLQNLVINGNLLLDKGIGEGDVTLNNVTVKGITTVKGGGANSIHFNNSVLVTVVIDKELGTVRIVAEGTTTIDKVIVNSPATIEEANVTSSGIKAVELTNLLSKDDLVKLIGSFESLKIEGVQIKVDLVSGTVDLVNVVASAEGLTVNLGKDAKIVELVLDAVAKFTGTGKIDSAKINDDVKAKTSFETKPGKVNGETPTNNANYPVYSGGGGNEPAPVAAKIENVSLKVDSDGLTLLFSIDQAIDLSLSNADVIIEYFEKDGNDFKPLINTKDPGKLIKNKTWSGYLYNMSSTDQPIKYSKGTNPGSKTYPDQIPAKILLGTKVSSDSTYINFNPDKPAIYKAIITVKNNAGKETKETVKVTVNDPNDDTAPTISGESLTVVDGVLRLDFTIDKSIDFDVTETNVELRYFYLDEAGEPVAITNNKQEGAHLVKDKSWDGYLYDNVSGVNYSQGDANNQKYHNFIPNGAKLATLVKPQGMDGSYVDITFSESIKYEVEITVTGNNGKKATATAVFQPAE
ncbi:S-layer homology domain-containing protein [Paenibacillaceae bacterium]|nr:S-layer homology domain-containing protein [Paenibacillaceae bacterium]